VRSRRKRGLAGLARDDGIGGRLAGLAREDVIGGKLAGLTRDDGIGARLAGLAWDDGNGGICKTSWIECNRLGLAGLTGLGCAGRMFFIFVEARTEEVFSGKMFFILPEVDPVQVGPNYLLEACFSSL
jgi:hypothetical protein